MIHCPHCHREFDPDLLIQSVNTREEQAQVIYDLYPRAGGAKLAKMKITKALKSISFDELKSKVEYMATMWRSADKQFCPMAATWFNQERFNDPSFTWAPQPQSNGSRQHVRYSIDYLTEAIACHPANPSWVGYVREKVTPPQREELKVWRAKLDNLRRQQLQSI